MKGSHTEDKRQQITENLIDAIRTASVDAPTWHLTGGDRWRVLRDTLLGHVRVRGKIRPRDLPLDFSCQTVIDSAAAVLDLPAYTFDSGKLYFRHWLAIFSLLPLATSQACPHPALSDNDLLCATIIELGFALRGGVIQNADAVAADSFVERLIGVLGLSQQEWNRLVAKYEKASRQKKPAPDFVLARLAAQIIALPKSQQFSNSLSRHEYRAELARQLSEFEGKRPHIEKMLAALDERACCYVTLKPERPQQYINRGTRHWMLRGASGWCSQSLALARDLIADEGNCLLFSDSDAVVGIWFPRTASQAELQSLLEKRLADFWQLTPEPRQIDKRFPRLSAWLRDSLPEGASLDHASNLPSLKARCMRPLSILEICSYQFPKNEPKECPDRADAVTAGACSRVNGDAAVSFRSLPPWLQEGNNEQGACVGITSMIWALCGTAFRTHAHEGLCKVLEMPQIRLQAVNHGEWLQQLRMPADSLVHLKIDGDSVGERFRISSLSDFPWLSMQLGRLVQQRLVAGVREAIAECAGIAGKNGPTMPIDVVYVGGDDVYVILPDRLLVPFLDGFANPLPASGNNPWEKCTFTFTAARLKSREQLLVGLDQSNSGSGAPSSDRFAAANLAASRLVTEGLNAVKKHFKGHGALDPLTIQAMVDRSLEAARLETHRMMAEAYAAPLQRGYLPGGRHVLRGLVFDVGPPPA